MLNSVYYSEIISTIQDQIHNQTIEKSNLFEFTTDNYQFVLAGYPIWKAFVAYRNSNIRIESYFRSDVGKRIFYSQKL